VAHLPLATYRYERRATALLSVILDFGSAIRSRDTFPAVPDITAGWQSHDGEFPLSGCQAFANEGLDTIRRSNCPSHFVPRAMINYVTGCWVQLPKYICFEPEPGARRNRYVKFDRQYVTLASPFPRQKASGSKSTEQAERNHYSLPAQCISQMPAEAVTLR
jgi:hypothetical protein